MIWETNKPPKVPGTFGGLILPFQSRFQQDVVERICLSTQHPNNASPSLTTPPSQEVSLSNYCPPKETLRTQDKKRSPPTQINQTKRARCNEKGLGKTNQMGRSHGKGLYPPTNWNLFSAFPRAMYFNPEASSSNQKTPGTIQFSTPKEVTNKPPQQALDKSTRSSSPPFGKDPIIVGRPCNQPTHPSSLLHPLQPTFIPSDRSSLSSHLQQCFAQQDAYPHTGKIASPPPKQLYAFQPLIWEGPQH